MLHFPVLNEVPNLFTQTFITLPRIIIFHCMKVSYFCSEYVAHVIHSSFIPLLCTECDNSLPFSGTSSIPLCYVLFPATLLHQLFFHPLSPQLANCFFGLPLSLVPKFIYNTLLGILFSSILWTCPNQRNLFNLIVSIIVGFLTLA